MLGISIVVMAAMLVPASTIKCHDDITLDDVQEYEFAIPHMENYTDILEYWGTYDAETWDRYWSYTEKKWINTLGVYHINYHINYILFGKFIGDPVTTGTTITAGYYTKNDSLIYSMTIDCEAETWTSHIIGNESKVVEEYQTGTLNNSCDYHESDDLFDMWLSIQQPHLMKWAYGKQSLQYPRTHTTYWNNFEAVLRKQNGQPYDPVLAGARGRERTIPIPSLYSAEKAAKYRVVTTGAAVVTRLAFGKCIAWPDHLSNNCTAVQEWIVERSKMDPDEIRPDWLGYGMGTYGLTDAKYKPTCVNTIYYEHLQTMVHPDQDSKPGSSWCCCVEMKTGKVYQDDPDTWCKENFRNSCTQTCMVTYDRYLWEG